MGHPGPSDNSFSDSVMNKQQQEFESKLETLRKVFSHCCLFCGEKSNLPRQTLLPTCEFCFAKYEVIKADRELGTISKLFPNICYFCQKEAQREKKVYVNVAAGAQPFTSLIEEKIGGVSHCPSCAARYKLLRELENEQTKVYEL